MQKQSYLSLIWDAIRGKEYDYTQGNINKSLLLLAIPMILEMTMESLFALVDAYFVGSLGKEAISVVGLTESLLSIIYAVAMGFGMGATAIISRRIGEKNTAAASKAAAQAIWIGLVFSILIAAVGGFYGAEMLALMGATPSMIEQGETMITLMLVTNVFIVLLFLLNGVFRAVGDALIGFSEFDQYYLLSPIHIWLGTYSCIWFNRSCLSHHHRKRHWRLLSTLSFI
jgi:Na+-driven multidrug efflux pump